MGNYYKVLRNIDGKLGSLFHPSLGPEYIPNEWVEPKIKGSQLMVFSNLELAKSFSSSPYKEVWECEIEEFKGIPIFLYRSNLLTNRVEEFLNVILEKKLKNKRFSHLSEYKYAIKGSVFCKRVKLIRKIK